MFFTSTSFPTNSEDDIVSFILWQSFLMEMLLIFSLVDVSLLVLSINVYLCINLVEDDDVYYYICSSTWMLLVRPRHFLSKCLYQASEVSHHVFVWWRYWFGLFLQLFYWMLELFWQWGIFVLQIIIFEK